MDRNATETTDQEKATAYLVYEFERRAYPLSDAGFTIGRDANSTIVLREPSVSRFHAEVRAEGGEYVLHASGATGTLLNGEPISTPRQLREGDQIEIGTAELTFRRSRLPLGVSVVDRAQVHPFEDVLSKRQTIANPILGSHEPGEKRSSMPLMVLFLILAGVAGYYLVTR
jgi:pSer/pThr/pTyr-binding forkhead associated (FHA) protein